ncbi:MAG: GTPase HflX, partial [Acidimicrobiaceae bacterium]|nr:GTPase HflX [Acidimicrobiaceae bacterium]
MSPMPEAAPLPEPEDRLGTDPREDDPGMDIDESAADGDTHRGGFGEFGGDGPGLIDRAFRERIVLVGVTRPDRGVSATDASLDELSLLVDTAGADAVERVCQRRAAPDPATFVGAGKAREIRAIAEEVDCDTVVFDDDLSPAQQFNLEKLLGRTALDRTAVILDIFAQNASTPEGKAQVELAQLRYRLPR